LIDHEVEQINSLDSIVVVLQIPVRRLDLVPPGFSCSP
jgi:hypothetical protein